MSTIIQQSQEIARKRAAWNRTGGGVLLTAELTGKDAGGVHWRVLVDWGSSVHTWRERLAPLGWSLLCWGNDCEALALVPSEAVAAEILKQADA